MFNPGAGDGVLQDQAFAMFLGEDAANTPEVGLFYTWMKKTHPSFPLDLFAMFGWAEARLFVDALKTTGSNPTQPGLIAATCRRRRSSPAGPILLTAGSAITSLPDRPRGQPRVMPVRSEQQEKRKSVESDGLDEGDSQATAPLRRGSTQPGRGKWQV